MNFRVFGPVHLTILAAVPAVAGVLACGARRNPRFAFTARLAMGVALLANELTWWIFRYSHEGVHLTNLPLQLCDFTLWATIAAALTLWQRAYEVAWFAGLAGGAMALLTPDLWAPWPSYPSIYFFLEHGGAAAAILMLTWGGLARPAAGSPWRALLILNVFALIVGAFNAAFGSNYMYLCRKPVNPSALDFLGAWPIYLLWGEVLAGALFWLLWLPFKGRPPARRYPAD